MNTLEERLRWLIDFANYPDHAPEDWEQLKLAGEIRNFVAMVWASQFPTEISVNGHGLNHEEIGSSAITGFRHRARGLLSAATGLTTIGDVNAGVGADIRLPAPSVGKISKLVRAGSTVPRNLERENEEELDRVRISLKSIVIISNPKMKRVGISGSLLELFSISCLLTLLPADLSRIASCPECPRRFYRVRRRQRYCSKRCMNRATRREWLKKAKNRAKEAEWAHRRYKRRVHQKTGGRPNVKRRSRLKK
jgi:hypothetical protein